MAVKLKHKIVVFTGAIASGKSTVKQILINILKETDTPYLEISGIRDLYLPFAIEKKIIKRKKQYQRKETTALMEKLYSRFGKDLGSRLLYSFLSNHPDNVIYLVDSKRNPEGILELKKICKNVLVVGAYADWNSRVKRYYNRQRGFDAHNNSLVDPTPVFKHEEDVFNISKSVMISDVIIENQIFLPHVVEVKLYRGLVEKDFLKSAGEIKTASIPKRGKNGSVTEKVLSGSELPALLDQFIAQNLERRLFVIQGGNRYVSAYLQNQKVDFNNLKLLDLSKTKFNVVLNTLLSPQERVAPIDVQTRKTIIKLYREIPDKRKKQIEKIIKKGGFIGLNDWLAYSAREELIDAFSSYFVDTPFTYPADDRKIRKEFDLVHAFADYIVSRMVEKDIIKILLSKTSFYRAIQSKSGVVFIDDVFYRGRTYYALLILTKLFDILPVNWELFTICADRVAQKMPGSGIKVLKPGVLYPFENSISTEMGYWDESVGVFVFRDIQWYRNFLMATCQINNETKTASDSWRKMVDDITKKFDCQGLPSGLGQALVELYIFSKVHKLKIGLESVVDQRSKLLGFCVPFVKILSIWVNQEVPRWNRQLFKDKVKNFWCRANWGRKDLNKLIKAAVVFYRKSQKAIDLTFLNKFLPMDNPIGTRECEIKLALLDDLEIQKIKKRLLAIGFVPGEEQLESDFIPDTKDFLCRKSNLLLRFRRVQKKKSEDILLTLKIGKTTVAGFQDARELQYNFSAVQPDIFARINEILKAATGIELPDKIHSFHNLSDLRVFLAELGFPALRTMIEKKRTIFTTDNFVVTFDVFPQNIGQYLEIEASTPEDLKVMIAKLKLPQDRLETRDYGDIVKSKKSHLSDTEQRTAVFDN